MHRRSAEMAQNKATTRGDHTSSSSSSSLLESSSSHSSSSESSKSEFVVFLIVIDWRQIEFHRIDRDHLELNPTLGAGDEFSYVLEFLVNNGFAFRTVAHSLPPLKAIPETETIDCFCQHQELLTPGNFKVNSICTQGRSFETRQGVCYHFEVSKRQDKFRIKHRRFRSVRMTCMTKTRLLLLCCPRPVLTTVANVHSMGQHISAPIFCLCAGNPFPATTGASTASRTHRCGRSG